MLDEFLHGFRGTPLVFLLTFPKVSCGPDRRSTSIRSTFEMGDEDDEDRKGEEEGDECVLWFSPLGDISKDSALLAVDFSSHSSEG